MIKDEHYIAFLGSNYKYYLNRLSLLKQNNRLSFNIDALFLGVIWVFYRKMYKLGGSLIIIYILIVFIESLVLKYYYFNDMLLHFDLLISLIIGLYLGFKGNILYLNYAEKKILDIEKDNPNDVTLYYKLKKSGGVSLISSLIILTIIIFYYLIPVF